MENKKAKLSDILENIKAQFRNAIEKRASGVAYMYITGNKILSVSVENVENDTDVVENTTKDQEQKEGK